MSAARRSLVLRVSPRFAKAGFLAGPWIFSALGIGAELLGKNALDPEWHGVVPLFSLSHEGNVPTLFQVGLLATIATMLWLIARVRALDGDRWRRHWLWLSIGFAYISIDEFASLHELLNDLLDLHGALFFGWVVPFGIAAAALGLSFVPFLLALPRRLAARFVLAGAIYVSGAIGMELPLGMWTEHHGMENLGYALLDWSEETLEMFGAGLFAASLFDVLRGTVAGVELEVPALADDSERPGTPARAGPRKA